MCFTIDWQFAALRKTLKNGKTRVRIFGGIRRSRTYVRFAKNNNIIIIIIVVFENGERVQENMDENAYK